MMYAKRIRKIKANTDYTKKLYKSAFPRDERIPFWLLKIAAVLHIIYFLEMYAEGKYIGFAYCLVSRRKRMCYIAYLAVNGSLRSSGYGSLILKKLNRMFPGYVLSLSIEEIDSRAENNEQRINRKRFYKKNGYVSTGNIYTLGNVRYEEMRKDVDSYV